MLWSGTPSQYRRQQRNSWSWIRRPKAADGTPLSQSPAWGSVDERAKARWHGWRVPTRGVVGVKHCRWRARGSAGAEARLCPPNIASLVGM